MKPPQQQRSNGEGVLLGRKLFSSLFIALIVSLGLVCFYYGASFAPALRRLDRRTADGSDPVFRHFIAASEEPPSFSRDGAELVVKSFRVCDRRLSELIPCLDRKLIRQLKLKLNLIRMEHYERHCPSTRRGMDFFC